MMRYLVFVNLTILLLQACTSTEEDRVEAESVAVTVWTDRFELFMEYPQLRVGQATRFAAHLTRLEGSQPVKRGPVVFEFLSPNGDVVGREVLDEPVRPGIFVPEVVFGQPGNLTLRIRIQSEGEIRVSPIEIFASDVHSPPPRQPQAGSGAITYLKEQQWSLPFQGQQVTGHTLRDSISASGKVLPAASRDAHVHPPVAGSFVAPPRGVPVVGQRVQQGQLLGWVEPPLPALDQTTLGAARINTQISLLELDRAIAETEAELAVQQARLELVRHEEQRVETLFEIDAVPLRRVEVARSEVRIREIAVKSAQDSLSGLLDTRNRLEQEGLRNQEVTDRLPLHSPLTGTLVSSSASSGAFFEARDSLFRVVDLSRVWVRADLFESDLQKLKRASGATLRLRAAEVLDIADRDGHLIMVGDIVDPSSRTLPVIWEIENADQDLKLGTLLQVGIHTGEQRAAIAIPATAVFQENERSVVYVQIGGETFERRVVQTGITDRGLIEIREGLAPQERIVVEGGYEVGLASKSSNLVGAGHVH